MYTLYFAFGFVIFSIWFSIYYIWIPNEKKFGVLFFSSLLLVFFFVFILRSFSFSLSFGFGFGFRRVYLRQQNAYRLLLSKAKQTHKAMKQYTHCMQWTFCSLVHCSSRHTISAPRIVRLVQYYSSVFSVHILCHLFVCVCVCAIVAVWRVVLCMCVYVFFPYIL